MTRLSEHFTLEELTFSATAQRKQIDNNPPAEVLENMKRLAAGLEEVRAALGNDAGVVGAALLCNSL